jgi:hypothetical protein
MVPYINGIKNKNMIISQKPFKSSTFLHDKILKKLRAYLNIVKATCNKSILNLVLTAEKLTSFPLKQK